MPTTTHTHTHMIIFSLLYTVTVQQAQELNACFGLTHFRPQTKEDLQHKGAVARPFIHTIIAKTTAEHVADGTRIILQHIQRVLYRPVPFSLINRMLNDILTK